MDSKWRVLDFTAYEGFLSYERGANCGGGAEHATC